MKFLHSELLVSTYLQPWYLLLPTGLLSQLTAGDAGPPGLLVQIVSGQCQMLKVLAGGEMLFTFLEESALISWHDHTFGRKD